MLVATYLLQFAMLQPDSSFAQGTIAFSVVAHMMGGVFSIFGLVLASWMMRIFYSEQRDRLQERLSDFKFLEYFSSSFTT